MNNIQGPASAGGKRSGEMTNTEAAISVADLTKYYGDLLAVDHASFEVGHGEFFGFLGPNGAGKTTTIRMLTNLTTPTEGGATILGYPISQQAVRVRELIGVIPETPNVFTELTALDNILFTGELYGMSRKKRKARAEELLSILGLEDKARVKAASLSKGLKRRLSIAMGLVHDPDLLFLDEPTSGLDVHSAFTIREILKDINRAGKTMFYTTHNLSEANELCQRIAIINRGKIITIDSPERLKQAANKSQFVEIAFDPPVPESAEADLRSLEGVGRVRMAGDKFRLSTSEPPLVLDSLYGYAREKSARIISLNTIGPTLEDVFMEITESRE